VVELRAQAVFLLAQFGGELGAEVFCFEYLANIDFRIADGLLRATFDPVDGLLQRGGLEHPVAGDQLAGFCKRAIGDAALAVLETNPCALAAWLQALAAEQYAGIGQVFVVAAHRRENVFAGHLASFGIT